MAVAVAVADFCPCPDLCSSSPNRPLHPPAAGERQGDRLARTGDPTIEAIEYLPSEPLPLVTGAKLSILDVRCRDRAGTQFVVEIQLIHMAGFLERAFRVPEGHGRDPAGA